MKTKLITLLFAILPFVTFSQNDSARNNYNDDIQTLFGNVYSNGGYLAFTIKYSEIDYQYNWDIGGRAAWIVNHNIGFGIAGYGFMQKPKFDAELNDEYALRGGYGGFFIEPILLPKFPVHIAMPVFFGAGGAAYTLANKMWDNSNNWDSQNQNKPVDSQPFVIVEPGIELEFNFFQYLRVCAGAYYRYTSNLQIRNNGPEALNGFSGGLTLKFGKF